MSHRGDPLPRVQQMQSAFRSMDADGNRQIDQDEFYQVFPTLSTVLPPAPVCTSPQSSVRIWLARVRAYCHVVILAALISVYESCLPPALCCAARLMPSQLRSCCTCGRACCVRSSLSTQCQSVAAACKSVCCRHLRNTVVRHSLPGTRVVSSSTGTRVVSVPSVAVLYWHV